MATETPTSPATGIWNRLQTITARKAGSARAKHFEFVRMVATGKELSERQIEEWHATTEAAGFTVGDAREHVSIVQRIAAAEINIKRAPSLLASIQQQQKTLAAISVEIETLNARRESILQEQSEFTRQHANASSSAGELDGLKAQLSELESD